MALQYTDNLIVCTRACFDFHQRKHHSPATPAFCKCNLLVTDRSVMENACMSCHHHENVTCHELPPLLCVTPLHLETINFLLNRSVMICCITITNNWGIPCATNCQTLRNCVMRHPATRSRHLQYLKHATDIDRTFRALLKYVVISYFNLAHIRQVNIPANGAVVHLNCRITIAVQLLK